MYCIKYAYKYPYIYIYIYIYTHTHTHIYIYIHFCFLLISKFLFFNFFFSYDSFSKNLHVQEAKGTLQKQSRTPTTLMTWHYWRICLIKQRHYCIVWNEPQQALASMSMHTKLNICVTTKRATLPH